MELSRSAMLCDDDCASARLNLLSRNSRSCSWRLRLRRSAKICEDVLRSNRASVTRRLMPVIKTRRESSSVARLWDPVEVPRALNLRHQRRGEGGGGPLLDTEEASTAQHTGKRRGAVPANCEGPTDRVRRGSPLQGLAPGSRGVRVHSEGSAGHRWWLDLEALKIGEARDPKGAVDFARYRRPEERSDESSPCTTCIRTVHL